MVNKYLLVLTGMIKTFSIIFTHIVYSHGFFTDLFLYKIQSDSSESSQSLSSTASNSFLTSHR